MCNRWLICGWLLWGGIYFTLRAEENQSPLWNTGSGSPVIAAHYMPWFNNPYVDQEEGGEWKHWGWNGKALRRDPETRREDGLRDIAATQYPLIGCYRSGSDAVIRYHLKTAKAAGIEALIVIWYGPGSDTDQVIPRLLDIAAETGLKICLCYEEKINWAPFRNPDSRDAIVRSATSDLDELLSRYSLHPAYLTRGGEPVVFQFNYWGESELGRQVILPDEWKRIFESLSRPVAYVRQNQDVAFHPPIEGQYLWFTSDEQQIEHFSDSARKQIERGSLEFFVSMIAPEFDDSGVNGWGNGSRVTKGGGLSLFRDTFDRAWKNGPDMIQIVTWNDFNEGTVIEPTLENGFRYLDALETWLGEKTGRAVHLEDNRIPFREYLSAASESARSEVPGDALDVSGKMSDLKVSADGFLETIE